VTFRKQRAAVLALALLAAAGCRAKSVPPAPGAPSPAGSNRAPPPNEKLVDRLAPGELTPGKSQVFGFEVPQNMRVEGAFLEVAYLEGAVAPEALANYVRERVDIQRVEIGAASTIFSRARIKRGAPDRLYDIVVSPRENQRTELTIRDVTPRPKNPPGMTDADRWRQAGRNPDGTPIDIADFK
jgi:hypothetical protein